MKAWDVWEKSSKTDKDWSRWLIAVNRCKHKWKTIRNYGKWTQLECVKCGLEKY